MKPVIIIAIAVICSVVVVFGVMFGLQGSNEFFIINDQVSLQTPLVITNTAYKYNTICDVGDYREFLETEVMQVEFEIWGGLHNENDKLIKFFKEHEILGRVNITPDQVYGVTPTGSNGLGPNYDPIFYDGIFWIPPALDIMNASPELVELFTFQEGDSINSYTNRLESEKNKCNEIPNNPLP